MMRQNERSRLLPRSFDGTAELRFPNTIVGRFWRSR